MPPLRLPAWPSADRRSRLVLITCDFDRAALVASVRLLHDPAVASSEAIERAIRAANPGAA